MQGYAGRIMEINLSTSAQTVIIMDEDYARECIGGIGFNARMLYDNLPPGTDALAPENVLTFGAGALVGSPFPAALRTEASAKSPQTGGFGTSASDGYFGECLKNAGYDVLAIKGRAADPVYIHIENERVAFIDADWLWGKDVGEALDLLQKKHNGAGIALIGPAGENQIRFASIAEDGDAGWGRAGLGAVMGAKNLKAIVVNGNLGIEPENSQVLLAVSRKGQERIKSASCLSVAELAGSNSENDSMQKPEPPVGKTDGSGHIACQSCPIDCNQLIEINEGKYAGNQVKARGIAKSTLLFGKSGLAGEALINCSAACQRLGLDMVGAISVIAFANELYQQGVIKREDVGYELGFDNEEGILALLEDIARKNGLGTVLAEGVQRAAGKIAGAEDYAARIYEMEPVLIDPRGSWSAWTPAMIDSGAGDRLGNNENSQALNQERFEFSQEMYDRLDMPEDIKMLAIDLDENTVDVALLAVWFENLINVFHALGICVQLPVLETIGPTILADAVNAFTGIDIIPQGLIWSAERTWNLIKMFNLREGVKSDDSKFIRRFYKEAIVGRPLDEEAVQTVMGEYYEARGWDEDGSPYPDTLLRYNLDFAIEGFVQK